MLMLNKQIQPSKPIHAVDLSLKALTHSNIFRQILFLQTTVVFIFMSQRFVQKKQ